MRASPPGGTAGRGPRARAVNGGSTPALGLLGDKNWYLPRWLEWLPRLEHEPRVAAPEVPAPALGWPEPVRGGIVSSPDAVPPSARLSAC